MSYFATETKTTEPLLSGDLNERFFKAVHEEPALFYDVIQTGWVINQAESKRTPYDIVLMHGGNVDDNTMSKMLALQEKIAKVSGPSADNVIDYKTEGEIIDHYSEGGLGLAILTADGDLIGQMMLAFNEDKSEATIKWLMVDGDYRKNNLCPELIKLAVNIAESSNIDAINANVRVGNYAALNKFGSMGFVASGMGTNSKDDSTNIAVTKSLNGWNVSSNEVYPNPITLSSLQDEEGTARFSSMLENSNIVGKWNAVSKWFTLHTYQPSAQILQMHAGVAPVHKF